MVKFESRFEVISVSRHYKVAKLNKLFSDFNMTELVLMKDDLDEIIHVFQEAKRQLIIERHHSVVVGFTSDHNANSHVYPELKCSRLKVMVGWETAKRTEDYSTTYTAEELEKELVDFNNRIRLI